MAIKRIYICDNCGAEQETSKQFWKLELRKKAFDTYGTRITSALTADVTQEWCRKCMECIGLLPWVQDKAPPKDVPETPAEKLEAAIREIASEES